MSVHVAIAIMYVHIYILTPAAASCTFLLQRTEEIMFRISFIIQSIMHAYSFYAAI